MYEQIEDSIKEFKIEVYKELNQTKQRVTILEDSVKELLQLLIEEVKKNNSPLPIISQIKP